MKKLEKKQTNGAERKKLEKGSTLSDEQVGPEVDLLSTELNFT